VLLVVAVLKYSGLSSDIVRYFIHENI